MMVLVIKPSKIKDQIPTHQPTISHHYYFAVAVAVAASPGITSSSQTDTAVTRAG
jgi:hypothetical protein